MTDAEIESEALAGELILRLKSESPERRASLLRVFASIVGHERTQEIAESYPPEYQPE